MNLKYIFIAFTIYIFTFHSILSQTNHPINPQNTPQLEWIRNFPSGTIWDASIDSSGNIYIAGDDLGWANITKYSSSGQLLWQKQYNISYGSYSAYIASYNSECFYVAATTDGEHDYLLYKCDTNGTMIWSRTLGIGGYEEPHCLTLDETGNIYVTGYCNYSAGGTLTVKYNPQGDTLWTRLDYYNVNYPYSVYNMSVDKNKNVYLNGSSQTPNYTGVMQTIKYDSMGNRKWISQYTCPYIGYSAGGGDVKPDQYGNCYVVGTVGYAQQKKTSILIKYNEFGDTIWSRLYMTTDSLDYGFSAYINFDDYGNVIISGQNIKKYDKNGNLLLCIENSILQQYGLGEFGYGPAINFNNHIYFSNSYPFYGFLTLGFNNAGALIFNQKYPEQYNGHTPKLVMISSYKNSFYLCGGNDSLVLIKYSYTTNINNISIISDKHQLFQNYPNPFNQSTIIKYQLSKPSFISIKIYNLSGKELTTLINKHQQSGTHEIEFNASNLSSGVYFYSMFKDNKLSDTKKLLLIK
ncbi:MAG: T9SS type A sorting domain-containing protein [Candidatus Kapaibacterium sp.]